MAPGGEQRAREAVNRILDQPWPKGGSERRAASRLPFFGPVSVGLHGAEFPRFSAFARDISPLGVGLLHIMPLECGEVVVTLRREGEAPLALRTQIMWCEDCGEGWYASGGRFLDVVEPEC
ncbi:MAG TPA: PilZ domain-containing protein [Pirellulales bacterium]|nr:PilZ domain-containing protein [Pirellulales bacterium]